MSSASIRAINSPRARRTASFKRHASPLDSSCRIIRMRGSPNAAARAALSSRDPSSMRTSSQSVNVCQMIERIAESTVAALSRIDMIIDTIGTGERSTKLTLSSEYFDSSASANGKSTFTVKETSRKARRSKRPVATHAPGEFIRQSSQGAPEELAMSEINSSPGYQLPAPQTKNPLLGSGTV